LARSEKKKKITNSLRWPRATHQKKTAKNSASERFVSLTDEDVERFAEAEANKNTQLKKEHSDVVLIKSFLPNENETRQFQDIPPPELDACLSRFLLPVRKKSGDEYEPTSLRGIIASVERYLQNLRYSKGQRLTVELFERHLLSEFLNLETTLWFSLCAGFDNERRVATLPNLRMISHIRVNR